MRLLEPIRPCELPAPASRDALSSLLRRRLLQASLCPHLMAGRLPPPSALPRSALSLREQASAALALVGSVLAACLLFWRLHLLLSGPAPAGLGLTALREAGWLAGSTLGVTAIVFVYYTLKLRRGGPAAEDVKVKQA